MCNEKFKLQASRMGKGFRGVKHDDSFDSAYIRVCNSKVELCVFVIVALINIFALIY